MGHGDGLWLAKDRNGSRSTGERELPIRAAARRHTSSSTRRVGSCPVNARELWVSVSVR